MTTNRFGAAAGLVIAMTGVLHAQDLVAPVIADQMPPVGESLALPSTTAGVGFGNIILPAALGGLAVIGGLSGLGSGGSTPSTPSTPSTN